MEQDNEIHTFPELKLPEEPVEHVPIPSFDQQKVPAAYEPQHTHRPELSAASITPSVSPSTKIIESKQEPKQLKRRHRHKHTRRRSKENRTEVTEPKDTATNGLGLIGVKAATSHRCQQTDLDRKHGHTGSRERRSSQRLGKSGSNKLTTPPTTNTDSPSQANNLKQKTRTPEIQESNQSTALKTTRLTGTEGLREGRAKRLSPSSIQLSHVATLPKTTRNSETQTTPKQRFDVEAQQQRQLNVVVTSSQDKYALKYSWNHLQMALCRSTHAGRLTMFTLWLCFLLFTMLIDSLKIEKTILLTQSTYDIVQAFDAGFVSNLDEAKFGWIVVLIVVIFAFLFFKEFLLSRVPCMTMTACVLILIMYSLIIIMSIIKQVSSSGETRPNFILVNVFTIAWLIWILHETYQLCATVVGMDDPERYPPSTIVNLGR
jgi:hypothetical protein